MPIIRKRTEEAVAEVKKAIEEDIDTSDYSFTTRKIEVDSVVSTGSTLLDLAISGKRRRGGGVPGGIMMEIFGGEGSGKTAILAEICASVQSHGGDAKFLDPEARLDKEYARIYQMNLEIADYSRPDTVTEVFEAIEDWRPKNPKLINVIATDSLAALSTELEMTKGDKMGMKRAKEFSTGFRKTARHIVKNNWLLACTNQTRQGDYGEVTPGGKAIAFYSSLRLRVSQKELIYQEKDFNGKKIKKAIGIHSDIYIKKSTVDDPYREVPIYIIFGYGIDDIRANLQYYKDLMNLNVYHCPDGKTYQALNAAIKYIESNGLQDDLREKIIDLWEEAESKFNLNRVKKVR